MTLLDLANNLDVIASIMVGFIIIGLAAMYIGK